MRLRYAALIAPIALVLLAVGCGGGDDDDVEIPDGPTGIASIDIALVAIAGHDGDTIANQVVLSTLACSTANDPASPPCADGEEDGSEVEVLPAVDCDPYYLRQSEITLAAGDFVRGNNVRVHSVYEQSVEGGLPGDYIILMTYVDQALAGTRARELYLTEDGVTGLYFGCSDTVAQLQEAHALADPIYTP